MHAARGRRPSCLATPLLRLEGRRDGAAAAARLRRRGDGEKVAPSRVSRAGTQDHHWPSPPPPGGGAPGAAARTLRIESACSSDTSLKSTSSPTPPSPFTATAASASGASGQQALGAAAAQGGSGRECPWPEGGATVLWAWLML